MKAGWWGEVGWWGGGGGGGGGRAGGLGVGMVGEKGLLATASDFNKYKSFKYAYTCHVGNISKLDKHLLFLMVFQWSAV